MTQPTHPNAPSGQPYSPPPIWQGTLPPPMPPEPPRKRSWVARHKILTGVLAVGALFVAGGIASAAGGGNDTAAPAASASVVAPAPPAPLPPEQSAANSAASKSAAAPTKAAPVLTTGQENAIGTAKDYLATGHFSRTGLIEQLVFEEYSKADATFAVNYLHVNFNTQAVGTAKEYLDTGHFSRGSLIEQLMFDGYTRAQATYAADQVGL